MSKTNNYIPTYDFKDGNVCFVTIHGDLHKRPLEQEIKNLLSTALSNDSTLLENELVALNRWCMHKDMTFDLHGFKSNNKRKIVLTKKMQNALHRRT